MPGSEADFGRELLSCAVDGATAGGHNPLRHVADLPPRQGRQHAWPRWADPDVVQAFVDRGVKAPWSHQLAAADLAHAGRHVVLSTGTASGKSVAYQLPILTALKDDSRSRVLYLSPTKALGHDQLRAAVSLTEAVSALRDVAPSSYDGDSPAEVRRFARERSRWIFSNPDMIHLSLLRNHARWAVFLRNLRYIVIDECHYYRGVFGSNVAMVLRRLLRLSTRYSATGSVPDGDLRQCHHRVACDHRLGADRADRRRGHRGRITAGRTYRRVVGAGAAGRPRRRKRRSGTTFRGRGGRAGDGESDRRGRPHVDVRAFAPRCRTHRTRCARTGWRRSHRISPRRWRPIGRATWPRTAAHWNAHWPMANCGGWRPPMPWNSGVDIAGLDAVVLAGFPGTVTSFWQQAGRAGRRGQSALIVLIARDDPLDTYLVHHPAALLDKPIERVVIDPSNPYVLGPQLLCAATELPLTEAEVRMWNAEAVAESLVDDGLLRRRPTGYFPTPGVDPHPAVDIRGSSGGQIAILEAGTGRMLGSAGAGQAPASVHPGAVYLHQGESYVVDSLDFEDGIAFVHAEDPGYTTFARELTDIAVTGEGERKIYGPVDSWAGAGLRDEHRDRLSTSPVDRRGHRLHRTGHADAHPGHHRGDVHYHT